VDGALAASVFHSAAIGIPGLKTHLLHAGIDVRPPPAPMQG
jgi:imidazole glycerol phosphate synthase subunit HisF